MTIIGETLRNFVNSGPLRGGQFTDKLVGNDVREYEALPIHLRQKLVHGTEAEYREARDIVDRLVRAEGYHFGYGAQEYVEDMRGMIHDPRNRTSKKSDNRS